MALRDLGLYTALGEEREQRAVGRDPVAAEEERPPTVDSRQPHGSEIESSEFLERVDGEEVAARRDLRRPGRWLGPARGDDRIGFDPGERRQFACERPSGQGYPPEHEVVERGPVGDGRDGQHSTEADAERRSAQPGL